MADSGCVTTFAKQAVFVWTLCINIVYVLWVAGFRHYHYGAQDAKLLWAYILLSVITVVGSVIKRRSWVYLGIITYLVATWTSFWYFWAAWDNGPDEELAGLNFIAKMVAMHWPLHIFHSIKDFALALVISQHYVDQFSESEQKSAGFAFGNLVLFAQPYTHAQMMLILAHVAAFIAMLANLFNRLHDATIYHSVQDIEYVRFSSIKQVFTQAILVLIMVMITYGIARANKRLMTMGYVFHSFFCIFAMVDMILMVRGKAYWFTNEPAEKQETGTWLIIKGVFTFCFSLWLARVLALHVANVPEKEGEKSEPKSNGNSREEESLLPK